MIQTKFSPIVTMQSKYISNGHTPPPSPIPPPPPPPIGTEILLEPVSVRLLPSDGNEAVFLCRMKTSDPFVIINDSLTYPGTFIKDVSIRAVSSDDRQYWNVTVVVKANQNSTKVQCLSTVGNTTSAANLLVVGMYHRINAHA